MFNQSIARAAAAASLPSIKGGIPFNILDAKYIQFAYSIDELHDLIKYLGLLIEHLEDPKDNNNNNNGHEESNVIPLINYVLCFGSGWLFNVNPNLKKRISLLCEGKYVKLQHVDVILNTNLVNFHYVFPSVEANIKEYKTKIYNKQHQIKLAKSFLEICQNTLEFYNLKLKTVIIERSANRIPDSSGRPIPLKIDVIKNFSKTSIFSLSMDLAVLITDPQKDTTDSSFRNLNLQVLKKFYQSIKNHIKLKIDPYYTQLSHFSGNPRSQSIVTQLTHWELTFHIMYAFMLNMLHIVTLLSSLLDQIYIPNKEFFNSKLVLLSSENIEEYKNLLKNLETKEHVLQLEKILNTFLKDKITLYFQYSTINDVYKNYIIQCRAILEIQIENIESWIKCWIFIGKGYEDAKKLYKDMPEERLDNLIEERLVNNKLFDKEGNWNTSINADAYKRQLLKRNSKPVNSKIVTDPSRLKSNNKLNGLTKKVIEQANGTKLSRTSSIEKIDNNAKVALEGNSRSNSIKRQRQETQHLTRQDQQFKTTKTNTGTEEMLSNEPTLKSSDAKIAAQKSHLNQKSLSDNNTNIKTDPKQRTTGSKTSLNSSSSPGVLHNSYDNYVTKEEGSEEKQLTFLFKELNVTDTSPIDQDSIDYEAQGENYSTESPDRSSTKTIIKKVRFAGVPPMSENEDVRPTKKGWYKKPAVLHYPSPSPQIALLNLRNRKKLVRQEEGFTFRTSLRGD
ncbi:protein phosphatase regulator GIP4 SCDLUD_000464 [Saccharomycodes ludwigii]|uniref:protein phosphatase regulator GIP4 n=1 Tax=Saccharomycodes ludwigii TaxID=36035 RepID=UPI001E831773|nr:hypothetical protein SCDLUD_000464 [Saccharomycodes ludwigii]KAH3902870.1 hypothetical protein SCDLUD_000464 [Saccharomycodes ludwigii]